VPRNLSSLETYLSTLEFPFSVIGLSETWLNDRNRDIYCIDGCTGVHNVRASKTGGGVSHFVSNKYKFKERPDLGTSDIIESVFVELSITGMAKPFIIRCIYRPPCSNIASSIDSLQGVLDKIKNENKKFYL